ncbi:MAG: response regulator [Planctomycetes bacterium]|nr:response regulator [Planctomycetota bacterium]
MTLPRATHFLIVDDDDDHAELITMEFADDGLVATFDRVTDGEAAIAYLRREGRFADAPRPDVILLDLKLPRLTGHEVLEIVKADEDLREIPVVVLTTSGSKTDLKEAYRRHVNSYLVKPADHHEFHEMVRELKLYWAAWNRAPASAAP